ncbi:MAG: DUF1304 family protein [Geminicoccaceae bacterium]
MDRLQWVALAAAVMPVFFAYRELFGWGDKFVAFAAPEWVGRKKAEEISAEDRKHIVWAHRLAQNMGTYNLALALGLVWVLAKGAAVADTLGLFLAGYLLIAAVAAWLTKVPIAAACQGAVGLLLLWAAWSVPM